VEKFGLRKQVLLNALGSLVFMFCFVMNDTDSYVDSWHLYDIVFAVMIICVISTIYVYMCGY